MKIHPNSLKNLLLGIKYRFKKDSIPWMKGKKGLQPWHNISGFKPGWNKGIKGIIKPNSGNFKKGQKPWNFGIRGFLSANKHYNWKGKILKNQEGYIYIFCPNHPRMRNSRIRKTWIVAESCLGRYLKKGEIIHHINEKVDDDRPKNLYLFPSFTEHWKFHRLKDKPILQSNLLEAEYRKLVKK